MGMKNLSRNVHDGDRRLYRRARAYGAVLAVLALLTACGSGSSGSSNASDGSMKLSVDETLIGPGVSDLFVAIEKGYFKDFGLNVDVQLKGSTSGTEVAAGHADITSTGATGSFAPAAAGHPTQIFYESTSGPVAMAVMVGSKSTAKSIMDLSGKKVTVLGVGTSTYGAAEAYSKYIVQHGGKALQIVPTTGSEQQVSEVVSGIADASIGQEDIFAPAVAAGEVRVLLHSSDPLVNQLFPPKMVNTAFWALTSNIKAKKDAFIAFVAGMRKADEWLKKASAQDIVDVLTKNSLFNTWKPADLLAATKVDQNFFPADNGYISEATWNASMDQYKTWGIENLDLTSPLFSYATHINMDIWNAATSKVS